MATIAVDAVGARAVRGFAMPSRYSSEHSVDDAFELATRLDIEITTLPIEPAHQAFGAMLARRARRRARRGSPTRTSSRAFAACC